MSVKRSIFKSDVLRFIWNLQQGSESKIWKPVQTSALFLFITHDVYIINTSIWRKNLEPQMENSWGLIATLGAYEANNLLQRGGLNLYVWLVEHGNRRGNRWINYIMHQEAAEPLNTSVNNNLLYTRGINQPLKQLYFQVQPQFTSTSCSYKNGLSLLLQFLFPRLACWENPQTTYAPQHLWWVQ